ncbi:MAG: HAD hydrolase-like protein [Calothrix sp. FI2-JRJ7]|jgi:phosphoglycolate phosphatase-like HAD superfamily hydrolase|nr:HAD hydrolase-like protein [Calothrix sp. FI2-JRJ7]
MARRSRAETDCASCVSPDHDTDKRKPYPDPIQKGLVNLGLKADKAVAIGDAAKDTQAARAAGVPSIGALWGSLERNLLTASQPDIMCTTVQGLREILLARYSI